MVDETDYEKFQKWTSSMGAGWAVWIIFFSVFFFLRKKTQGEEEIISVFWLQHYGNERKEVKYSSAFCLFINKTIDRQTRLFRREGEVVHHFWGQLFTSRIFCGLGTLNRSFTICGQFVDRCNSSNSICSKIIILCTRIKYSCRFGGKS